MDTVSTVDTIKWRTKFKRLGYQVPRIATIKLVIATLNRSVILELSSV